MQTVSSQFTAYAAGRVRPLAWQLRASFDKTFSSSIDFFTLDTSTLGGDDVLAPADSNVISEWDKYNYTDYSDRVISIETTREVVEPYSIVQSYADVTLNNYDNYFTPNSGSPIDSFILPKRPFRILMGFGDETVPVFVGISDKMPEMDKASRTARFHLIDFLSVILEKNVGNSVMLIDNSTSEILDVLFQQVGLLPDQYELDTSFNRVPFFYVEKNASLGSIVKELMQAEQGRLYLDELGVIRFLNRQNYATSTVYSFDKANTLNYAVSDEDDIINHVRLTLDVLAVQPEQSIWASAGVPYLAPGATYEVFANLDNPATSVTTPTYSAEAVEASHFRTTTDEAGEVAYAGIVLSDIDVFATAVKLTFTNSGSSGGYIQAIDLWGTPVKTADTIVVEDSDQASIDQFEDRLHEFTTRYIQTRENAITKVAMLIDDYKDFGSLVDLEVKGSPALQIDDGLDLDLDGYQGAHVVTKIVNGMSDGRYWQRLRAKFKEPREYFLLDDSQLDGTAVLAP